MPRRPNQNEKPRVELAYAQLASSEIARDINRNIVLELIRSQQPIARADLSQLSGLQPSTVSSIAEQLLKERWITEGGVVGRPRGRRPTLLSLNDTLVMLVADVRPNRAIVAVVDLNGHPRTSGRGPYVRPTALRSPHHRHHGGHAPTPPRPHL